MVSLQGSGIRDQMSGIRSVTGGFAAAVTKIHPGIGRGEWNEPQREEEISPARQSAKRDLVGARRAVPYQVSGIRGQGSDQLAVALPPEKIFDIPIGFHLIPDP
jgi:hypothetical protein